MKLSKIFIVIFICVSGIQIYGCTDTGLNQYSTFIMNQGSLRFSIEYPGNYLIDYMHPAETIGDNLERGVSLLLKGPKDKHPNNYTYISVGASPPDTYAEDAKTLNEKVENNAASWDNFTLLYKGDTVINGIHAYRLKYQKKDIIPAIAGDNEPRTEVIRRVDFDYNGFIWTIYIDSFSETTEADKSIFENVLRTFKILE